jgi:hypothetical protein
MIKTVSLGTWRACALALVLVLAGCSSGPTIITNSAPDFNLAGYRTFSFYSPLSTDNGNVRSLISSEVVDAARPELEAAGLQFVESGGELLVNFAIVTRETLQTRPSTNMAMTHRRGLYSPWGGYSMMMQTQEVVQRTEGTLAVDVIDASRRQLVWEGTASGNITNSVQQNRAAAIERAVRDVFAQFP